MEARKLFLLLVALAAAPFADGHGSGGEPKTYCEWSVGDVNVHDYGRGDGFSLAAVASGDSDGCLGDATHFEYADGGALLVAAAVPECGWPTADHLAFPTVYVSDVVPDVDVRFWVYADTVDNLPSVDPDAPECGDLEADVGVACVNACAVPLPPGLDGTYVVFVEGVRGHVWTGSYVEGDPGADVLDSLPVVREVGRYRAPSVPPPIPCLYGCAGEAP